MNGFCILASKGRQLILGELVHHNHAKSDKGMTKPKLFLNFLLYFRTSTFSYKSLVCGAVWNFFFRFE